MQRLIKVNKVIFFLAVLAASAQAAPDWLKDEWRAQHYSSSEFYTGFSQDNIKGIPNKDDFFAIEKSAQSKLSESIVVQVQTASTMKSRSVQKQHGKKIDEAINSNYEKTIKTESNSILAKVETKSYFDEKSGYLYALAVVSKIDLAEFYKLKIKNIYSKIEQDFSIAEIFAEQSKKKSTLEKLNVIEDSLKSVEYWENYLNAVETQNNTSTKILLIQKINTLKQKYQNSTYIYLEVSAEKSIMPYFDELAGILQEKGCNCAMAETSKKADYSAIIKAKFKNCMVNNRNDVYCYASAAVTLNILKDKKPINLKIPEAKGGWTNGNKEKAIDETFKGLINNIAEKIIQTINQ